VKTYSVLPFVCNKVICHNTFSTMSARMTTKTGQSRKCKRLKKNDMPHIRYIIHWIWLELEASVNEGEKEVPLKLYVINNFKW